MSQLQGHIPAGGNGSLLPEDDPSSIGNLAIEMGYITLEELKSAVSIQQQRLPLGQILVDMGKLTPQQLEDLLFEQRIRRGEIRDTEVIRQYERSRMRKKVAEVQGGFRELGEDAKRLTTSFFAVAQTMRARVK